MPMHKPPVSPIARSLWLGALGLALLLPAPALAAPDLQIDWPEPGGEAKPKAPAKAAPTAPPAAPVKRADPPAEAEIEVELDLAADVAPATKSTPGATKKSSKSTKSSASSKSKSKSSSKRSKRPSTRELREAEAAAEREAMRSAAQEESARAHRDAARAHGAELIAAGRPREAARELAVVAAVDGDPLLFLAAAEASLVDARERSSSEGLAQARGHVASAKDALAALRSEPAGLARLGLDVDTLPAIDAHIAQVVDAIDRRSGAKQRRKVALGEVISGSVLTAIGLSGLGVMSGGLYLDASADAELERAGVQDINALPPNLQPAVRAQVDRASTMIAVGSIVGAAGTALGVTLVTIGARDVKKLGGLGRKRASLRAAPTFGGIVVSGRF